MSGRTLERLEATLATSEQTVSPLEPDDALLDAAGARVAIEGVSPEIDGGRFAVKRAVGDVLTVEADIFGDGHDKIGAALLNRCGSEDDWHETPMQFIVNDRWQGTFPLERNAGYQYTIIAWRDLYASWCDEVAKKHAAGQAISLESIPTAKACKDCSMAWSSLDPMRPSSSS
jgi:starch synthase (maltosyl-transferring)